MTTNASSAELINHKAMSNVKTAASTDRHVGQLRHESELKSENDAKANAENNIRGLANVEIGRSRNIERVV